MAMILVFDHQAGYLRRDDWDYFQEFHFSKKLVIAAQGTGNAS